MSNEISKNLSGIRYLCFRLGDEGYAIPLLSVREVIAVPDTTKIPGTPNYFLGIMNLRGQVISVIDLRTKFQIKPKEGSETAVIICDIAPLSIGVVVDSINYVFTPKPEEIAEKPELYNAKSGDAINGVYRNNQDLVLFLDIAKALNVNDLTILKQNNKRAA